jgi:sporulation protein YlmC with PRC-barrel domain
MNRKQTIASAITAVLMAGVASAQAPRENTFEGAMGYSEYLAGSDLRASELIGATVRGRNDQDLGEIEELVVSRDDDIVTAVLSVGGVLGVGEKLIGVPYEDLRISPDGESLYLAATVDELEARPSFEYERELRSAVPVDSSGAASRARTSDDRSNGDRFAAQSERTAEPKDEPFREPGETEAVNDVHEPTSHANLEREGRVNTTTEPSERSVDRTPEPVSTNVATMDRDASRVSKIIGTTVTDSRGESLGEIDDLVLSAAGRMEAVVAVGGILGIGERLVAVPVDDLMIETIANDDGEEREVRVRIDMTAEEFIEANPEFRYDSSQAANLP